MDLKFHDANSVFKLQSKLGEQLKGGNEKILGTFIERNSKQFRGVEEVSLPSVQAHKTSTYKSTPFRFPFRHLKKKEVEKVSRSKSL